MTTTEVAVRNASELATDELVQVFVQLRDRRSTRKKAFENEDNDDKAKLERIEGILLERYSAAGIESARTQHGTAYKSKVGYASIADWDAFKDYVIKNDAWELLSHGANKVAVQQHIDANSTLPPGLNWREEVHIRVQRA
jgi:hypothetical protein